MFENRQIAVIEVKFRRFQNSFECLKNHYAANNWPIWTKRCQKKRRDVDYKISKIFCWKWTVGCQKLVQYILMFLLYQALTFSSWTFSVFLEGNWTKNRELFLTLGFKDCVISTFNFQSERGSFYFNKSTLDGLRSIGLPVPISCSSQLSYSI